MRKLKTYTVDVSRKVIDHLAGSVNVDATSEAQALRKARKLFRDGKVGLEFDSCGQAFRPAFEVSAWSEEPDAQA